MIEKSNDEFISSGKSKYNNTLVNIVDAYKNLKK